MRYIEIDGKRYEVRGCIDCPCCDEGDSGYGAWCKHPRNSEEPKYGTLYGIDLEDVECPLREVEE